MRVKDLRVGQMYTNERLRPVVPLDVSAMYSASVGDYNYRSRRSEVDAQPLERAATMRATSYPRVTGILVLHCSPDENIAALTDGLLDLALSENIGTAKAVARSRAKHPNVIELSLVNPTILSGPWNDERTEQEVKRATNIDATMEVYDETLKGLAKVLGVDADVVRLKLTDEADGPDRAIVSMHLSDVKMLLDAAMSDISLSYGH